MKDLADRNKAAAAHWEAHLKKLYLGEVEGDGIDIIIWDQDGDMNPEEWAYVLRKYSSFVIQGRMAELNPNDINYFKGRTITDPNTGNKISLHCAVVENVDDAIYSVQN
jgi:hypothetical protein